MIYPGEDMAPVDYNSIDPAEYTRGRMARSAGWCRMGHGFTRTDPKYWRRVLDRVEQDLVPCPADLWQRIPWIWAGTLGRKPPLQIDADLSRLLADWLPSDEPIEALAARWGVVAKDIGPPLSCVFSSHPYADVMKWSHLRSCPWS